MNRRTFIFLGFFLILMVHKALFVACTVMKFTNVMCESYNESLAKVNMCRIRAVSRHRNTFNYIVTLLDSVYSIKSRFQFFKRANGYKPFLYDFSIDSCQFLRKPTNAIAILLRKQLRNYSNFFDQKCPVSGTKTIDGFYINKKTVSLPWPTGEFMIQSSWILNEKLTLVTNLSFQCIEDLI